MSATLMGEDSSGFKKKPSGPNPYAAAFGTGFEMIFPACLGAFAGQWVDGKLGTEPWLLLLGTLTGVTLGFYQVIRKGQPSKKDHP